MKEITLTQGKFALIDDEDFDRVSQFKWYASKEGRSWYAKRGVKIADKQTTQYLHRFILGLLPGRRPEVDHQDGDGLNNCRLNLRLTTSRQNIANNRKRLGTTSKFKGVHWDRASQKWKADIQIHLGYFDSEEEAARAYNEEALRIHGQYARLNDIKDLPANP